MQRESQVRIGLIDFAADKVRVHRQPRLTRTKSALDSYSVGAVEVDRQTLFLQISAG